MSEKSYAKNLVKVPVREVSRKINVKGRTNPTLTYMSNDQVPGSNMYIEFGWIWDVPDPNPHIPEHGHDDYDEIVLHIGCDPRNPEELGAEIEFTIGEETLTIDKTSAIFVPRGVKHGPVTWKRVDKPHIQMAMVIGAGTLEEADPGGQEKL